MSTNLVRTAAIAAIAPILIAAGASASTVNASYQTPGDPFGTQNYQQRLTVTSPGYNGVVRAGAFQMIGDNGLGHFTAFCVDIFQALADNTQYTTNPSLFTSAVVANVDRLFSSVYGTIDTAIEAAAFQVSLWEIVNDTTSTSFDLDGGQFSISGNAGVESLATSYLTGLASAPTGQYNLTFMENPNTQDIVTATPVPLPASFLLVLGGLGGLAAFRNKKRA